MKITWFIPTLLFIVGCGHNMYTESDVIGFHVSVPVGSSWIGVTVGQAKQVVATIRGGASFETTSTSGGGLLAGAGGISKVTQFKTNAQLNEGNVTDIMLSKDVDPETKQTLAKVFLPAAGAPNMSPTALQTRDATVNTGVESVTNPIVALKPTGVDKIIDGTPAIIHAATEPITDIATSVTDGVAKIGDSTVDAVSDSMHDLHTRGTIIAVIIVIFGCIFVYSQLKNKKPSPVEPTNLDDLPPSEDPTPTESEPKQENGDTIPEETEAETEQPKTKKQQSKLKVFLTWLIDLLKQVPIDVWKKLGTKAYNWYKEYSKNKKKTTKK